MIYEPNDSFDFSKLSLCKPIPTSSGGSFFIKFIVGEKSLYIQPPKCTIKQVVSKSVGKKTYCDLIFQQENDVFIRWMETLETHTQQSLYDHRQEWFKTDLERDDIEQSFASPMKVVKSGKQYIIRAIFATNQLKIYDEDEDPVALESIVENTSVMVILEIQGVRTGNNSFQVDIEIKQMMVMKPEEIFSGLRIKYAKSGSNVTKEDSLVNSKAKAEAFAATTTTMGSQEKPVEEPIIQNTDENVNFKPVLTDELEEVNIEPTTETIQLKERKEMYYQMYQEARQKARVARDLALSAYLEAKQIKNKYMLDDILESSSDESDDDETDLEKDE
jgi:hypothetical protein